MLKIFNIYKRSTTTIKVYYLKIAAKIYLFFIIYVFLLIFIYLLI